MSDDAITELEQLLREEREAIRRLDGASVLTFAERKEGILKALQQGGGLLSSADASRLRALIPALRHNSVLLAHARDVLRDALVTTRAGLAPVATSGATTGARAEAARPRILSVRG